MLLDLKKGKKEKPFQARFHAEKDKKTFLVFKNYDI